MPQQQPATVAVDIKGFGRVHFPATFTPEQIETAIERDILQARQPAQPAPERTPPSTFERVGHGVQRGVDRVAQLVAHGGEKLGVFGEGVSEALTQNVNEEETRYQQDRGPDAGFDVASAAGNIGILAPLMLIPGGQSVLGRAALGAVGGGAGGAMQFDETDSAKGTLRNVGTGAAAGAVLGPIVGAVGDKIGPVVSRAIGRLRGVFARFGGEASPDQIAKAVPELAELPDQTARDLIAEAQAQIKRTGAIDEAALARKANLLANEVTPTKSMVTRDPADWSRERNLQKLAQSPDEQLAATGQELTRVYQANDTALTRKLDSFSENLPKATQEAHGENVMRAVDQVAKGKQAAVGKAYDAVHGEDIINPPPNALVERLFSADLQDIEDPAVKTVIKTVENRLKRLGIVKSEAMIGPDGSYSFELTGKGLTAKQAEELRKLLNGLDTPGNAGRVKSQIIQSLDQSITREGGTDVYAAARAQAAQRFQSLDNPAAQRALDTLGELQQGKTAQNFIKSQVIDAAEQDVRSLVETVSKLPPEQAEQAIGSLRAGVLQHLQGKAINPNSGQFSGAALNRAITEIGEGKLMRVLGVEQYRQLQSLARAALDATYQPPYAAVNHSNTAPMLLSLMRRARGTVGVPLPGLNEVAERGLERMSARSRLAEALAARSPGRLTVISPRAQQIGKQLLKSWVPASQAGLDEARKSANARRKDHK